MSECGKKMFRPYDPDAPVCMPVSLRDWLPQGHLAYLISDVVDTLDLSEIYTYYEREHRGQPPYDPRLMVKLLLYAYTVGMAASRRIEKKTYEDIAFRVLTADQHPDHDTICDFRITHRTKLCGLFTEVLAILPGSGAREIGACQLGRDEGESERLQTQGHELRPDAGKGGSSGSRVG